MTLIGNLLLLIATLIYVALVSSLFCKEPQRGGDAAVGYLWNVIFLNVAFTVCITIVAIIIAYKGGFGWVSPGSSMRFFIVTVGLLATVITSAMSGLFKYENGPVPGLIRFFSGFVPILVPLVLIAAAIVLLNKDIKNALPVVAYKWPLLVVYAIGLSGVLTLIADAVIRENRRQAARAEMAIESSERNHQDSLQQIDSCDVTKNMVFILVFTYANQDKDVQEKAVAKVKTHPQWQQELVARLKNDWAPQAFVFLASNDVDDPALFAEPIHEGILIQAKLIRESIRQNSHPSHFYNRLFYWEIEKVLRTVDRFSGNGKDYRPAVKQLRAALDEPTVFDKSSLECYGLLDEWIKRHL